MRTEFEFDGFSVSGKRNELGEYENIEGVVKLDAVTMALIGRIVKMYAADDQVVDVKTVIRRAIRRLHDEMLKEFEDA